MSLKIKQSIKNLIKISTLILIFILGFFVINTFATIEVNQDIKTTPSNNANYKNIVIKPLANVWVAITTNIWLGLNKSNTINETNINNNIFPVIDFYENKNTIKNKILETNMIFTKEYFNIIKMDFNSLIKKSSNKSKTLDNIIKQLEIRYTNANVNLNTLNKQKEILISEYQNILIEIESIKIKLENDFEQSNIELLTNDTNSYYELKNKENILNTNIIFIQELIKRYTYLNNYNKLLLDTLINNKDIISKDSYLIIPDSGNQLLKDFDLIFTEEEYKNKK